MTLSQHTVTSNAGWFFFSGGPGAPRYGDDPTKHAVDHDTESFVREVLQNANDQGLDNSDPVKVTFRFLSLTGEDRLNFLKSLGWETELRERLQTVADNDSGQGYNRLLQRISDPEGELRLLIVEDRNTTGLTGSWSEDSNYAALVRDELYSSKQDDTAGGSYGLGKSVLWTFSGASTVLFNSYPANTRQGKTPPRFIGRTKLSTHKQDGMTYQGAGWLCSPCETNDGTRPESLWGDEAAQLVDQLHLDRPAVSGTSAMVVGFRDPTRDTRPDMDELADKFLKASVKYFWPAIYRGDLHVTVETPEESHEADVDHVPAIRPFVECYASRNDGDEILEEPGDVTGLDIPLNIPPKAVGTETSNGSVRLAARLASPADDDTYLNHVALFRGAGMVVKYYDQSRVAFGDRNFHGVLASGEARTDHVTTDSDQELDRFLRFAEPPEHDEWESTENLREQYQQGFRKALDDMFGTLRDGLRHLVARSNGTEDALSEKVLRRFPIHGGLTRRRSINSPSSVFNIESNSGFNDGQWTFEGHVAPLEEGFEGWTAEISMTGVGEDGSKFEEIPIVSVDSTHKDITIEYENGSARIIAGSDATDVHFKGKSQMLKDADFASVRIGETQLEIQAELRTPKGD